MKEFKLAINPKIAARVALELRRYASEQHDKLIGSVAAAIEAKPGARRGRYN
jgi:hypothetical protein